MQISFLPTTLNEWLGIVVTIAGVVSASWALALRTIRGPLQAEIARQQEQTAERFRDQGVRVGEVENHCERNAQKIEDVDRANERLHLQMTGVSEQYGRIEAKFDELLRNLETRRDERQRDQQQVLERLARIETRLETSGRLP